MTVSEVMLDSLRRNVERAERDYNTASPQLRTRSKLVLQMARAALEDAVKETEQ